MFNTPLHPAIVHLPLGLALALPFLALAAAWRWRRQGGPGALWWAALALQALVMAGALAAERTGEQDEERVEAVVPEAAIEHHEELAERFVLGSALVLGAMAAASLLGRRAGGRALALASATGLLVNAGLAMATGHAGGELVYVHGAASAHAKGAPTAPAAHGEAEEDHDED